jgi:uncharacterized protein YneF (UPF0154 family)
MSTTHLFFIPAVLLVGLAIGYVMGAKAVRTEIERKRQKMRE